MRLPPLTGTAAVPMTEVYLLPSPTPLSATASRVDPDPPGFPTQSPSPPPLVGATMGGGDNQDMDVTSQGSEVSPVGLIPRKVNPTEHNGAHF